MSADPSSQARPGFAAAKAAMRRVISAMLVTPVSETRSRSRPHQSMCTWLSMSPGTTVPGSARVAVPAGTAAATSAGVPVAATTPSSMATAWTRGCSRSSVRTSPVMMSADMWIQP
jgi:hypothetical protein